MQKHKLNLRWMARRRGISVGLLGGEELVLWRLRLLSMEGEACTVILCWKSAICRTSKTVIIIPAELLFEWLQFDMYTYIFQHSSNVANTTTSEWLFNLDVLVCLFFLKAWKIQYGLTFFILLQMYGNDVVNTSFSYKNYIPGKHDLSSSGVVFDRRFQEIQIPN